MVTHTLPAIAEEQPAADGEMPLELATSLQSLGQLQSAAGQYADAVDAYRRALAIAEAVRGATHPANASLAGRLATFYRRMGNYSRAEELRLRALRLVESARLEEQRALPTNLNNLAVLHKYLGQYARAEDLYLRTIAAVDATRGADSSSASLYRSNLAEVYRLTGRHAAAKSLLRDVLASTLAREPHSRFVAHRMVNLGDLYAATGLDGEALLLYLQAHGIL